MNVNSEIPEWLVLLAVVSVTFSTTLGIKAHSQADPLLEQAIRMEQAEQQ
ncbi:MAG: hypothetical protein ACFB5Z_07020 [Elainellaceae cyanobacterium]